MNPKKALQKLLDGNARFVSGEFEHPNRSLEHRQSLVGQQTPFAAILSCSDSRASPEILFDQGVGDLFTVRLAGNVASTVVVESLGFAVDKLGVSIVLVMGHQNCGAIQAVLQHQIAQVNMLASLIEPAISSFGATEVEKAVQANVLHIVQMLQKNELLAPAIRNEKIEIVGAYYCLDSGRVSILPAIAT
ncbi:MAG: Carbonic anhydrase 2 [Chlamydiae bacterium]|nr:Carbonic anhydrase 2 [Chlamydiota bacterium]